MVKSYKESKKVWQKIFGLDYQKCKTYKEFKKDDSTKCGGTYRMSMRFSGDREHLHRKCIHCPIRILW